MNAQKSNFIQFVMVAALLLAGQASASLLVLQPGPGDGKDAQITNAYPDFLGSSSNFGSHNDLVINWGDNGRSIGLLQFDLSGIPGGATVSSSTLSLYHSSNSNFGRTYNVFRVTSAWDESLVTFDTAPAFDPSAVASLAIPDSAFGVFRDWDVTGVVAGWLSGAYANYGLWIEEVPIQGSGSAYFRSSDYSVESQRPILSVNYSANNTVPEPASLALLGIGLAGLGAMRRRKTA